MSVSLKSLAEKLSKLERKVEIMSSQLPQPEKPSRFIDNGDGTVTDKDTNLVWMKQDDGVRRTWEEAKKYCDTNQANLPGTGWRLPTVKELISLIEYEKHDPAIDPVFIGTQSSYYWSSTPHADSSAFAWYVFFGSGVVSWYLTDYESFVRPVRQNS